MDVAAAVAKMYMGTCAVVDRQNSAGTQYISSYHATVTANSSGLCPDESFYDCVFPHVLVVRRARLGSRCSIDTQTGHGFVGGEDRRCIACIKEQEWL